MFRTGLRTKGQLKAEKSLSVKEDTKINNTVVRSHQEVFGDIKNGGTVLTDLFNSSPIACGGGQPLPAIGELLINNA